MGPRETSEEGSFLLSPNEPLQQPQLPSPFAAQSLEMLPSPFAATSLQPLPSPFSILRPLVPLPVQSGGQPSHLPPIDQDQNGEDDDDPVDVVHVGEDADDSAEVLTRVAFENQMKRLFSQSRKNMPKKTLFFVLPDRTNETREKFIQANVVADSIKNTDEWSGYCGLNDEGSSTKQSATNTGSAVSNLTAIWPQ